MANVTRDVTTSSTARLFGAVREAQDQNLRLDDEREHARARARLLQAIDQAEAEGRPAGSARPGSRATGWRWGLGAVAAAACALALVFALPGDPTLEYQLDGVAVASADIDAPIIADSYSRALAFSDTTSVVLAPHGRMYIDELRSNGASVVLEQGEVTLSVHHEDDTSWRVAAGPYAVHVTGTEFSVLWEPSDEHFEVMVSEGSVRVDGPEGQIASLRGGDPPLVRQRGKATIEHETLEAAPDLRVAELDSATTEPVDVPDEQPVADAGEGETEGELDKPRARSHEGPAAADGPSWTDYFDDADYDAAWAALDGLAGGIHGEAKRADVHTLLDLADVARFTKHRADARQLLELLRDRHPGTDEAGEAAFTLGRLAAAGGSPAQAASWFELYLDERPDGPLVGEALGRLLDSYEALGRDDAAKSTATRYLARLPNGPHAQQAQKLLGE